MVVRFSFVIYLKTYLIYVAKISQQSLYMSRLWTINFLGDSGMLEQNGHNDLRYNDANINKLQKLSSNKAKDKSKADYLEKVKKWEKKKKNLWRKGVD